MRNENNRKNSSCATSSMVLGILSFTCFNILTGIPAVIMGHIASKKCKVDPEHYNGKGKALAGLILGYGSIAIFALFILISLVSKSDESSTENKSVVNQDKDKISDQIDENSSLKQEINTQTIQDKAVAILQTTNEQKRIFQSESQNENDDPSLVASFDNKKRSAITSADSIKNAKPTIVKSNYIKLEYFDFSPEFLKLILAKAEAGDPYAKGLYAGLAIWGYVVDPSAKSDENTALEKSNKSSAGSESPVIPSTKSDVNIIGANKASDDWFGAAEVIGSTPTQQSSQANTDWLDISAASQCPIGQFFKAYRMENDKGIRNVIELRGLWKSALIGLEELSDNNDPVALTLLGVMYQDGYGVTSSREKAISYYQRGAEFKSALASYKLALLKLDEAQSIDDYREVIRLNEKAKEGSVKSSFEFSSKIFVNAGQRLSKGSLLNHGLPGEYYFLNWFLKSIVRIGAIILAILGGLFGWFIFPYMLAPIKLLLLSTMEIYLDRVIGALFLTVLLFFIGQIWLTRLLY